METLDLASRATFGSAAQGTGGGSLPVIDLERLGHVGRYTMIARIGEGGMGVVYRVMDPDLQRTMALKVLRVELCRRPSVVRRFVEEARVTAQLQHPGIVPVHEIGALADGRVYFTMKEVEGRTLRELIREAHMGVGQEERALRRLIEAFRKVCEAVAYAHAAGVIHRDLKPGNIMVGDYGEVLVLDWGLARLREVGSPFTDLSSDSSGALTQDGSIPGTPWYMSPEQAAGAREALSPASDVYALGAILYEIMVGLPPHAELGPAEALRQARGGLRARPSEVLRARGRSGLTHPELEAILVRATALAPRERTPDAARLSAEVGAWLEGDWRREQALGLVSEADLLAPRIAELRSRAERLAERASATLQLVPSSAPVSEKLTAWETLDEVARLLQEAEIAEVDWAQRLHAALNLAPALDEAHQRLADHYRRELALAEASGDVQGAVRYLRLLQIHDRGDNQDWIEGRGGLTLITDPPAAEVLLYRYQQQERRLVPHLERSLGQTPIVDLPLPMGSFLLALRREGYEEVRYPVHIGRGERWGGVAPGEVAPRPVSLPPAGSLSPEEVYVPAGWYASGLKMRGAGSSDLPVRRWLDGFVIQRHPVTNADYLNFLNSLVTCGRLEEALAWVPRERAANQGERGAMVYGQGEDGRFYLREDTDGDMWSPDWPVVMVDWWCGQAYARWLAERSGLPWRLPIAREVEKASRGVDGRDYPWGDAFDATFCCMAGSHRGRPCLASVYAFPIDESPYGVRGTAGNTRTWCLDAAEHMDAIYPRPSEVALPADRNAGRTYMGGNWNAPPDVCKIARRPQVVSALRTPTTGFRLARSWP